MPRFSYVNGRYSRHNEAKVHIEDRGYQFSDAIYEVIACVNGHFVDEKGHLDRLERSLDELKIPMPKSRAALQFIMRQLLQKNRLKTAGVYIQISRGSAPRDFLYARDMKPTVVMVTRPFSFGATPKHKMGVRVQTCPDQRWSRRDIKTTGLLAQSLAKTQAHDAGFDDAWMVDDLGYVTEGSSNNAWIVKDGTLITRHVSSDILKGVTRNALLDLSDLKVEERSFTPQEAYEADEAFTTSATLFIMPVISIDGHSIGGGAPGTITQQLLHSYIEYMNVEYDAQISWSYDD
jgi:D-alanine transaminase